MPRPTYGTLKTIEYIGPRPQKPKRTFFGGWMILAISVTMAMFFGKPLLASLKPEQLVVSGMAADRVMEELETSGAASNNLAVAALSLVKNAEETESIRHSADFLLKVYQKGLNMDVKQLLHDDMCSAFSQYPQLWYELSPSKDLDATRLPNIQRLFHRSGEDFAQTEPAIGDVVFWALPDGTTHAAVIVPGPGVHADEKWIVHYTPKGVLWENKLKDHTMVLGRYRFGH
jgi:hypothetical protein